jgi:two-component system response regulator AtoC
MDYDWPGNVRELRTAIEHGVVMSNGPKITLRHLPNFLREAREGFGGDPVSAAIGKAAGFSAEMGGGETDADDVEALNLERMERQLIRRALEHTNENRTEAAKLLGISRRTLQRKLKEMG